MSRDNDMIWDDERTNIGRLVRTMLDWVRGVRRMGGERVFGF